jgi:aldose 1-epimerase
LNGAGRDPADPALRPFRLRNARGLEAEVVAFGATLVRLRAPDAEGRLGDVVLALSELDRYRGPHPMVGSTVGRFANRIGGARFALDGREYRLAANDGAHHLHGGSVGFHHVAWRAEALAGDAGVRLRHRSADGDEGYPGNLEVETTYRLGDDDALRIEWRATTDAPTIVNLTNHAYFNLEDGGAGPILDHELWIGASHYAPVDPSGLPTGELRPVAGTPFDFATPRRIGERIEALVSARGGYDHPFALDAAGDLDAPAARLVAPRSRRALELRTTQRALQLYTGNFLDGSLCCAGGVRPGRWHALSLEPQGFPNAPNEPRFPSARLDPGEVYRHTAIFALSVA